MARSGCRRPSLRTAPATGAGGPLCAETHLRVPALPQLLRAKRRIRQRDPNRRSAGVVDGADASLASGFTGGKREQVYIRSSEVRGHPEQICRGLRPIFYDRFLMAAPLVSLPAPRFGLFMAAPCRSPSGACRGETALPSTPWPRRRAPPAAWIPGTRWSASAPECAWMRAARAGCG